MNALPMPPRSELKEAYAFTCTGCGHEQMAAPSIFMEAFGMNTGGGSCMKCDLNHHLEIDVANDCMKAIPYIEWAAAEKARIQNES